MLAAGTVKIESVRLKELASLLFMYPIDLVISFRYVSSIVQL